MKKTLIALAAVAAATAASAQVTLSGAMSVAIEKGVAGSTKASFADKKVHFNVSEDLGGGLKFSASTGINFASSYGDEVTTRDTIMTLAGGFGKVVAKSYDSSPVRFGAASLPNGDIETAFGGTSDAYSIKYTTPAFSGVTLGLEASGAAVVTNLKDSDLTLSIAYANGPLGLVFDTKSANSSSTADVTRILATYDAGFASFGVSSDLEGDDENELSVSVPVNSALTLNLAYGDEGANSATEVAAVYALSKTTSLNAGFAKSKIGGVSGTATRVKLLKTF